MCFSITSLMKTKLKFYVKSCSVHFVGIALKKKALSYKTKPRHHLVLQWDMDHSIAPIYIWKSVCTPGIGISQRMERHHTPLSPGQLLFQFLLPVLGKTTQNLSSCENLSDLSSARKAWSSLPYTTVQAGWIVGWSKGIIGQSAE